MSRLFKIPLVLEPQKEGGGNTEMELNWDARKT